MSFDVGNLNYNYRRKVGKSMHPPFEWREGKCVVDVRAAMLNYFPKFNEFQVLYLQYSKLRQTLEIRFVDDGDVVTLEVAVSAEEKKERMEISLCCF